MMLTLVNVLALLLQAALVKQAFKLEREIIATACKHKAPKPVSWSVCTGIRECVGGKIEEGERIVGGQSKC